MDGGRIDAALAHPLIAGRLRIGLPARSGGWFDPRVIRAGAELVEHIAAAYGLPVAPPATLTVAARGAVGQIWRLDLGPERYAVKELFFRVFDEQSVRREVAFSTLAAAAGVRLPASLPDRGGRFLVEVPADLGGGWLRLYRWVDGDRVDQADPGLPGRLGALLGRLHAHAPPPGDEPDPWYESAPDPAVWPGLVDAALTAGVDWGPPLAERAGLLVELSDLVTPAAPERMVTCHRDLHPQNVLVDGSGELVLLDWDEVGPACPDRELARLLLDWHVADGTADAAAVTRTVAAYRAVGGPGRLRDERSFGMVLAADLNFLLGQASRALDPAVAGEHRAFAVGEVRESLGRLPTPALLTELIALAR